MNQPGTSTGAIALTAGTQSVTGSGILLSVECVGGSAAGTVTVYDGTSTGGTRLASLAGVAIGTTQVVTFPQGVVFNKGLFIVVSGTGATGSATFRLN